MAFSPATRPPFQGTAPQGSPHQGEKYNETNTSRYKCYSGHGTAVSAESSFKGKTVTIYAGASAGGTNDGYTRLVAEDAGPGEKTGESLEIAAPSAPRAGAALMRGGFYA